MSSGGPDPRYDWDRDADPLSEQWGFRTTADEGEQLERAAEQSPFDTVGEYVREIVAQVVDPDEELSEVLRR